MTFSDIQNLTELATPLSGDFFHFIRKNEFGMMLSYSAKGIAISSLFDTAKAAKDLENRIKAVQNNLNVLSAKFITKANMDANYASKERLNLDSTSFLTQGTMESRVSNYATQSKMNDYAAQARQEANKLADEASDFAAAAMVGINQSGAGVMPEEPTE